MFVCVLMEQGLGKSLKNYWRGKKGQRGRQLGKCEVIKWVVGVLGVVVCTCVVRVCI